MSSIQSYKDLLIWKKGIEIVKEVYFLSKQLPKNEEYAISDQIRRAAVSIPANIAEGYGRASTRNYLYFVRIARGSLFEVETLLTVMIEVELITAEHAKTLSELLIEEGKMINSFIKSLEKSETR